MAKYIDATVMCRYKLILSKKLLQENIVSNMNNYLQKRQLQKCQNMKIIFEIVNGSIETLNIEDDKLLKDVIEKNKKFINDGINE